MIEKIYGTLFILIPNHKNNNNDNYLNNINSHQQAYITPFDIHDTILHIAYGNNLEFDNILYSQHGKSLLTEFEDKNRNCKEWEQYFIVKKECLCQIGIE